MTASEKAKYAIKVTVARILYALGLLQLWQTVVMRRKAVVLMYHRVLSDDERRGTGSHPGIVVSRETFETHMALLKRRFVVLSLEEFTRRIEQGIPFPDRSCVITFDDGWKDNFTNALPVLRKHRLPAVIFLPVNFIGRQRLFWREALTHLLVTAVLDVRRDPSERPRLSALLAPSGLAGVLDLADENPRAAVVKAIERQGDLRAPAVDTLVSTLAAALEVRLEDLSELDGFMEWDQIRAMARQQVTFGGHGAEHYLLDHVPPDVVEAEIQTSRRVIGEKLDPPVLTFSYPNGSFTPKVADSVRAAGYRAAFTTRPGFVTCDAEPFTLPRLNVHETMTSAAPMFLARVVGLF